MQTDSKSLDPKAYDPQILKLLREIYGSVPSGLPEALAAILEDAKCRRDSGPSAQTSTARSTSQLWDEKDCVLITYADQIRDPGRGSPLQALGRFFEQHCLQNTFSTVHLLPFCPWTSDDGFSVVDYLKVDPQAGSWEDIHALGSHADLMFDLVLNHCSQQHDWFQRFLACEPPFDRFFKTVDPAVDLSQVVRPRSLPLLTPFQTRDGVKHVWTTFSADQVDLNYETPAVLIEMARTFVEYALLGARIIRLDAVAFLWKDEQRRSLHEPQTHAIVRLMRRMVDIAAPGTIVLTETNVPHEENLSYFGDGDEAHMVYQFSLPPLLIDAIESGDGSILTEWLATLRPPTPDTTFFNFTASHDGIGVRPLEGIVSDERLHAVLQRVQRHGGAVSMRNQSDGTQSPYELNITYMDAVASPELPAVQRATRFLATQTLMTSMQGVPAVYFQSLVGAASDREGMQKSGHNRAINRKKYETQQLGQLLHDPDSPMGIVFTAMRTMLERRRKLPAMHPNASQRILDLPGEATIGLVRGEKECTAAPVTALVNLSESTVKIPRSKLPNASFDFLSDAALSNEQDIHLEPYQGRWIGSPDSLGENAANA